MGARGRAAAQSVVHSYLRTVSTCGGPIGQMLSPTTVLYIVGVFMRVKD